MLKKTTTIAWFFGGFCGITAHDIVSAYFPDGGHIPGLHAFYFAMPLAAICGLVLLARRLKWGHRQGF